MRLNKRLDDGEDLGFGIKGTNHAAVEEAGRLEGVEAAEAERKRQQFRYADGQSKDCSLPDTSSLPLHRYLY